MKDRIVIVGGIVAVHLIVISLFIFSGNDSSDDPTAEPSPQEELADNSSDESIPDVDKTPEELRDDLFDSLTGGDDEPGGDTQTYIVQGGDSLSKISQKFYGTGKYYNYIFEANRETLKSPQSVRSGQKLIIPPAP